MDKAARIVFFSIICLAIGLSGITCIKRNNEWDPLLRKTTASRCSLDSLSVYLEKASSILRQTDMLAMNAFSLKDSLQRFFDSQNKALRDSNSMILTSNVNMKNTNKAIDSANRMRMQMQTSPDSLEYKNMPDSLFYLFPLPIYSTELISDLAGQYARDSASLFFFLQGLEISCPDFESRIKIFTDSSDAVLSYYSDSMKNVKASLEAMEKIIDSINVSVRDYNKSIKFENDTIQSYNDSIYKEKWADRMQGFTVIKNGDSLNNHLKQAQPGDTFIVRGPITRGGNLQLSGLRGTASDHIAIIGNLLTENIISVQAGIFFDSCEYFDISNVSIKGSQVSGLKLDNHSNNINLSNCIIEGNGLYGLDISTSGITVTNCKIQNNKEGGIRFVPELPGDYDMNLTNVLIAKNKGIGIELTTPSANLRCVTITNNDSNGISINSPTNSSLSIFNSIISFNGGFGIYQMSDKNPEDTINLNAVDLFQNISGNLSSNLSGAFFSYDPNFTDTTNNDFSIAKGGKIYDLESQFNTIVGYR